MKILLNEDKEQVKKLKEKIAQNKGHCCCAIVFTDDNLCMCKEFKESQEEGFCDCGLFRKIN